MRVTIGTLPSAARRSGLGTALRDWWFELPWRRRPLRALKALLFTEGRGWLRWGLSHEIEYVQLGWLQEPDYAIYAPPLRRAAIYLWGPLSWVLRGGGWRFTHDPDPRFGGWRRMSLRYSRIDLEGLRALRDDTWPEKWL